jgi:Uncharacterised protein family (UPF0236)
MGNSSITQNLGTEKEIKRQDPDWEKASQQEGHAFSRERAIQRLMAIEERLFQNHPPDWESKAFKERTLTTYFGDITIRRRLYQDDQGGYHYLLDEYLGWPAHQLATSRLQEDLVELATQIPFRQVSQTLEKFTAGALSASTIYRLLKKTAQAATKQEKADWQALYEKGVLPPGENKQVPILFSEGDGVFVHLQQEEPQHYEVKQAIAYEGWEKLPVQREDYRLVGKRVYCQADEEIPFWEGVGLEWARVWDLGYLKEIVIGGDGASWIDSGVGEFPGAIRQLDGFHLARACGRGWEEGKAIYQAIRAGEAEVAHGLVESLISKDGQGVHKARQYVERNLEKGRDWRTQSQMEGRGLGTMEANEDKLVANRMKKRGLSWTIKGALRMNKAIQLAANGETRLFCERPRPTEERETTIPSKVRKSRPDGHQKWLEASLPALSGPYASRPWVRKLRDMALNPHLLN